MIKELTGLTGFTPNTFCIFNFFVFSASSAQPFLAEPSGAAAERSNDQLLFLYIEGDRFFMRTFSYD